jgi:hypothetical protein
MAQIVIFAPEGEDVSAGEQALKDAGHDVEVVSATAANLLHLAVGMLEDAGDDEPATEDEMPAEDEPAAEDEMPAEEMPAEEEPPVEESIGNVTVDGEMVPAYMDRKLNFPLLRVVDLTGDGKLSYNLNESTFTFWRDNGQAYTLVEIKGKQAHNVRVEVQRGNASHIILDANTAKLLRLV